MHTGCAGAKRVWVVNCSGEGLISHILCSTPRCVSLYTHNEKVTLLTHLADLSQPSGTVLSVPVDIMRSLGDQVPDVIIKKPEGQAVLILDIELSRALVGAGQVNLVLRNLQNEALFTWESTNIARGRLSTAFQVSSLPEGKVWLEMSDVTGETVDSRLLEFR